ncbi:sulfatase-like hydrolase/transferase [Mycobacterium sp. KBS0706]|uniref:sulfatase-like hydrolase/transferase n=1 Tax=Mycobacterium sp. KBS0706 TaxID=2578109 RepID=UPI00163DB11F|nr:sulfatase-like hydrolase/transferase [Mycobacterium sp. KBS0706]
MPISDLFANGDKPNILILITDQERALSEWPASYRATLGGKLKAMQALAANGLSFEHAYTGACMCAPSRATFLTSQYPIVTGCTTTGSSTLPLPDSRPNLATVLGQAGYNCYWIGKWHLLGQNEHGATDGSLAQWGFRTYRVAGTDITWDPPDAGLNLSTTTLGGGTQGPTTQNQNDQRYVGNAQAFLANPPDGPWCLVVSLVNPHDVHLAYLAQDGTYYDANAYKSLDAPLPDDRDESPLAMPRGQSYASWQAMKTSGAKPKDLVNFYAYLMQYVDGQIGTILGVMSQDQRQDTLIIRFADHGEMALSHGLVEKFVNAYGQCTHVPLVFSNPVAWPQGQTTEALASTVDLAPTLASLLGVAGDFAGRFVGQDLSDVLDDPSAPGQDYVHFTYDDINDQTNPSVIRTIRSKDWVYSVYLQSVTSAGSGWSDADWEMYDLTADPGENRNIAGRGLAQQTVLDNALQSLMTAAGTAPAWYPAHWPPQATSASRGGPPGAKAKPVAIGRVPGIPAARARDLNYVGVLDAETLLARTATPDGRQALAGLVPATEPELDAWIAAARSLVPG